MYTPEELLQFTKTKLHSISIIYRLMKNYFACLFLGLLVAGCQSNQRNSRNRPAANTSLNKVVKKNNSTKVTNDAATILSKEVPILCYHNIFFDAVLAND
jgi:hypothetical protein